MRQLIGHVSADYVTFITALVVFLLVTLVYLYWSDKSKKQFTFPTVQPSDPVYGNLKDFKEAGSIHNYLTSLHKKHGGVVGFWWGKELALSLGSVNAFKDISGLFDRPVEQFILLKPLVGEHSIQYANGVLGKKRRHVLDKLYSHATVQGYIEILKEVGEELISKLKKSSKDEHIPLRQYMLAIALKSILRTSFGDFFKSDKEILKFEEAYDVCMEEMESYIEGDMCIEGSERDKAFKKALEYMKDVVCQIIEQRRNMKDKKYHNLLDVMLEDKDLFPSNDVIFDNAVTYLIGGFHTTGNLMTWALYYLTLHEDVQNKLFKEVQFVLSESELNSDALPEFEYLRQVVDETLRVSVLSPWAARFSEYDIVIDGHVVAKDTPLIMAAGVVLHDPEIWEDPEKFNPERFSKENKKNIASLAFSPFGFAGKRKCPGYRFAYLEATIFLALLIKNFKFSLVEGQDIKPVRRFVSQPDKEIWITVERRES